MPVTVAILNSHTLKTLRGEVAKSNITNYAHLKKSGLISKMMSHASRFNHIKQRVKAVKKRGPNVKKASTAPKRTVPKPRPRPISTLPKANQDALIRKNVQKNAKKMLNAYKKIEAAARKAKKQDPKNKEVEDLYKSIQADTKKRSKEMTALRKKFGLKKAK